MIQTQRELSPVQYARLRGLSLNYVYSLLWLGVLPAAKVDGRWLIDADAVLERQKRGSEEVSRESVSA